ncbi:MAG TPA: site-specific DNA-methyltransferase [Candidatus Faecisoma merdavium]|nr:site-specific DNA-methyltransferase [Candidatus Faecisoma merdavium]
METTNLSKIRRNKMLNTINEIKKNITDEETLTNLSMIENELTKKKYGLIWEEHEERVDKELETQIPTFEEVKDKEIVSNPEDKFNFLLEGDNLHSLYLLEKTHKGLIDVIYIDPPYNTGSDDFIYNDKIIDNEDGYKHSKWLSFMEKRLRIAKELLNDKGIIFISIDDNEIAQLKLLCDDIFNETNRISIHHIQVRYAEKSLADGKSVKPVMEYVLVYAKDYSQFKINLPKEEYTDASFIYEIKEISSGTTFKHKDNTEIKVFKPNEWIIEKKEQSNINLLKETWVSGTIYSKMSYGQVVRKYIEPRYNIDGLGCLYKVIGRGDDGLGYRYYVGPAKKGSTRCKMYSGMPLSRVEEINSQHGSFREVPISNLMNFAADFGNIRHEGNIPFNSGKKPVKMLKELINYHTKKDATILDFFAGSGSTAQAVLELNSDDNGQRHFILCTNNENQICENITYKRIKNVIEGYGKYNPLKANLKYYKCTYIPRINTEDENLHNNLLINIKNLIQLENGIEIDDNKIRVYLNEDELDKFSKNQSDLDVCEKVYISSDILLTSMQESIFKNNNIEVYIIPEYYFEDEIMEVM